MCRFVMYRGPEIPLADLVTRPRNSLIHQSFHAEMREEPLNGDGFGVAWYDDAAPREPAQYRSISPAWNDANLRHVARVTRSGTILAHVRAATPGLPVIQTNCHPFINGRYAFMHNGNVAGFLDARRSVLRKLSDHAFRAIEGTTDSEHIFALFLDRLDESASDPLLAMADALAGAIDDIVSTAGRDAGPHLLNLAVTDGERAAACRYTSDPKQWNTLFVHSGRAYVCDGDVCRMLDPGEDGLAVLVASEPLSDDDGWEPVPINHIVTVSEDRDVEMRPL